VFVQQLQKKLVNGKMLHHHAKIKFVVLQDIEQEVEYFIIVLFKEKNVKEYKKELVGIEKQKI